MPSFLGGESGFFANFGKKKNAKAGAQGEPAPSGGDGAPERGGDEAPAPISDAATAEGEGFPGFEAGGENPQATDAGPGGAAEGAEPGASGTSSESVASGTSGESAAAEPAKAQDKKSKAEAKKAKALEKKRLSEEKKAAKAKKGKKGGAPEEGEDAEGKGKKGKKKKSPKPKKAVKKPAKPKKEKKQKVKPTKEEKLRARMQKEAAKHERKIEAFEKRALLKEKKLEAKAEKKARFDEIKSERKSAAHARADIKKERARELKQQRKYWLKKGVGKTAQRLKIVACAVLVLGLATSGAALAYKSDKVDLPFLNAAVDAILASPVKNVPVALEKPAKAIWAMLAPPVENLISVIKGPPKFEDFYYYEPDKAARYEAYHTTKPALEIGDVVWMVNAGADLQLYEGSAAISDLNVVPMVVNKFRSLPQQFAPRNLTNIPGTNMQADKDAYAAFEAMRQDAEAAGLRISVASAYRSYDYQAILYNPEVPDRREKLVSSLAKPGFSEHQTGMALDLCVAGGALQDFPGTPEAEWLAAHAEDYGFLLRYTKELEPVTGFREEPWHVRYVGADVIKTMNDKDIESLEEYKVKLIDHKEGDKPAKPETNELGTEGADGPI